MPQQSIFKIILIAFKIVILTLMILMCVDGFSSWQNFAKNKHSRKKCCWGLWRSWNDFGSGLDLKIYLIQQKKLYNKPKPHGSSLINIIYYCNKSVEAQSIMNTPPCMMWRCVQCCVSREQSGKHFIFGLKKDKNKQRKNNAMFVSHSVQDGLS